MKYRRSSTEREHISRSFMLLSFVAAAVLLVSARWQTKSPTPIEAEAIVATTPSPAVQVPPDRTASTLREALYPVIPMDEPVVIVDLSDRQVQLYRNSKPQATYPIAVGQAGWETPTGSFQVLQKLENPRWQHPITGAVVPAGPDNPLGSRWIGFWTDGEHHIGFHGTNQTNLIGQAVSHGCIRMRDADVQQLYSQVNVGTAVVVQQ